MIKIFHWKHYHTIILVFYLVIIAPAIWWLAGEYQYNRINKNIATSQAQEQAQKEFDRECLTLTEPNKILACYREKIKSARETQRAEEDLQSQKDMASWALGMLIVSGILGFLSLGVAIYVALIVRDTLDATRKATEAAIVAGEAAEAAVEATTETGEAQVRAYITISNVGIQYEQNRCPTVSFTIYNTGNSPTRHLKVSIEVTIRIPKTEIVIGRDSEAGVNAGVIRQNDKIPVNAWIGNIIITDEMWKGFTEDGCYINVTMRTSFFDVFKKRVYDRFTFTGVALKPWHPETIVELFESPVEYESKDKT